MAYMDYNTITPVLNTIFEDDVVSQINRACVLSQILPIKPVAGKNVQWDVRVGTTQGGAIADGAAVTTYNLDTKVAAALSVATYNDAFGVAGRALSAAWNSSGPEGLRNLFAEEVLESSERLATAINQDMYVGLGASGPETIAGLTGAALLASGTYAGISIATYPQWAATVLANSGVGRDLSLQLMRDTRKAIYIASGMKPDFIVCDPNQHERLGNLYGQFRRYVSEIKLGQGAPTTLDGGYQVLEFDGIPVIEDKDCPAGKMLFLNSRVINLRVLPDAVLDLNPAAMGRPGSPQGSPEEQYGPGEARIGGRIQPLAINGDLYNFSLYSYLQLQVRRPNACGILADLNTP